MNWYRYPACRRTISSWPADVGADTRTVTLTTSTMGSGGGSSLDLWSYKQVSSATNVTGQGLAWLHP